MSDHDDHRHVAEIVHHRHYRTLGRERDKDLIALCRGCAAEAGILCDQDGNPRFWDVDLYPYHSAVPLSHPCWRPGPDWPPSWNEVEFRQRERTA